MSMSEEQLQKTGILKMMLNKQFIHLVQQEVLLILNFQMIFI